jgi:23S rRNA (uracil1939-C5)-methyltransferase
MVNIVTSKEDPELLNPINEKLIKMHPEITSIINNITSRRAGVSIGEKEVLVYGKPRIHEKLGEYIFEISSNSFFQTNTTQAEKLYNLALEYGGFKGDGILYDLFCGTGSTSIFMSSQVKKVYGFELVQSAVEDAARNAAANGIDNCRFIEANLDHYFRTTSILKELEKPDVVLLDPPRAGLHKKLVKDVIQLNPQKIVYISCNPATQARDAALFCEEEYVLEKLGMVDMFPHTPHIEMVVLLTTKYNS